MAEDGAAPQRPARALQQLVSMLLWRGAFLGPDESKPGQPGQPLRNLAYDASKAHADCALRAFVVNPRGHGMQPNEPCIGANVFAGHGRHFAAPGSGE